MFRLRSALAGLAVTTSVLVGSLPDRAHAADRSVAYFRALGESTDTALLIDWLGGSRARVVTGVGARFGSVVRAAGGRMITLDASLFQPDFSIDADSCGEFPPRQKETTRFLIRDAGDTDEAGPAQVLSFGLRTALEGCDLGVAIPFGVVTDAGIAMTRVPMNERPSMADLVPGTRAAGLADEPWASDIEDTLPADVVTLYAGGVAQFAAKGNIVPVTTSPDRWLVFDFGTFQRAYTRLAVDRSTAAERWLRAEWVNGVAERVAADLVVKADSTGSFGNERRAARVWESGLARATPLPFYIALYPGGTGERIATNLAPDPPSREPVSWVLAGQNIMMTRQRITSTNVRTWVPLRNYWSRVHFVLESETQFRPDGSTSLFFLPRINFYIDRGPASPGAPVPQ